MISISLHPNLNNNKYVLLYISDWRRFRVFAKSLDQQESLYLNPIPGKLLRQAANLTYLCVHWKNLLERRFKLFPAQAISPYREISYKRMVDGKKYAEMCRLVYNISYMLV